MHTATLRAVGGSVSVTLPRQMLRTLGLTAGASVAVTLEDGRLVLSPARPRYRLDDLLAGMRYPRHACSRRMGKRKELWDASCGDPEERVMATRRAGYVPKRGDIILLDFDHERGSRAAGHPPGSCAFT